MNFVNRGTMEELTIEEISGIAFIYNQVTFLYLRGDRKNFFSPCHVPTYAVLSSR